MNLSIVGSGSFTGCKQQKLQKTEKKRVRLTDLSADLASVGDPPVHGLRDCFVRALSSLKVSTIIADVLSTHLGS